MDNLKSLKGQEPPRFALRLLFWFCPAHLYEEIEGDLIQRLYKDARLYGERKARRRFIWNSIRFFRPGIILRNQQNQSLKSFYMVAHYFKIASRIMIRNKAYSMINVFGLALGMTGAILLFLWIEKEFSYDQFHADKAQIYKAWSRNVIDGKLICWDATPRILAPTVADKYASVESAVSYGDYSAKYLFTVGEKKLMKNGGVFTDPQFLTMFSFPLLKGNSSTALSNPSSIVITENFAKELFGEKEAFGETLTISEAGYNFSFTVTGVLKNLPSNTDFDFQFLVPFQFMEDLEGKQTDWGNHNVSTYVKLKPGTDENLFNQQLKDISKKNSIHESSTEVFLYPLEKMHLYSKFENGIQSGGRIEIIRMLIILGTCLIAIACINFINLNTARAQKRLKEVGIRKVSGALRKALITQFLCESVLIAFIAGLTALLTAYISLPWFNELVEQQLTLDFQSTTFWLITLGGILIVGILAGSYPAFYLSSFSPALILKGVLIARTTRNLMRKSLVIIQFGFAVILIFSVIVIYRQIDYVQHREIGYSKENLIYHFITGDLDKNFTSYKRELLQSRFVESVTKTSSPITEGWSNTWALEWQGKDPESKILIDRFNVDEAFTKTAGIQLVSGRDMDLEKYPSDSTALLLNESAVKVMGFNQPIGELIKDGRTEWHVVGVIKDFILQSPYQKVRPMVLQGSKSWFTVVHIRLKENLPVQDGIRQVSTLFTKYNPAYPFEFHFVDESYQRKFSDLQGTLKITSIFSSITICIACLGLLGLSTYVIEARIKEIGIRRVLGGSVVSIAKILWYDSIKPILIALLIFSPFAWMVMSWWLQFSEYRISLDVWLLLVMIFFILLMATITVGVQTIRAANSNPINSLKIE